jgi:hypothetical protein
MSARLAALIVTICLSTGAALAQAPLAAHTNRALRETRHGCRSR